MPVYHYKARNARGDAIEGRLEAPSVETVADQLLGTGVTPVDITEQRDEENAWTRLQARLTARRPSLDDLILMSRQLYTLLRAGVPIVRALTGLAENTRNPVLAEVLHDVVQQLESGRPLSSALNQHSKVFNSLFVSMIQVGETTGRVDEAFLQLSQHLESEKDIRDRIKAALRYPVTVLGFIVVAMFIINIYVIPQFANLFKSFKAELPLATRILVATSDFFLAWWPAMLAALVIGIVMFTRFIRTEAGEYKWDRFKLKIPYTGSIVMRATLARFARAFSMTLRAGVPLTQSLAVVSLAVDNRFVGDHVHDMRNGVERGDTLTRTARATEMFTPLVLQMMAVGEETGAVDELLEQVADFYEREVNHDLKRLSATIEPVMIVIIGVMVLILAMGIFLPMWDLVDAIRK
ncbi:MAG TPA: type II secretion system F family protein [Gammaproteobacteria bacterium]|nr:type II secretion system F family protein [Gammaproteobacteria bacterium]